MKYVYLLAATAVLYLILARQAPLAQVQSAMTATEVVPLTTGGRNFTPASGALKQPLDRTHAVLDQAQRQNGAGEF